MTRVAAQYRAVVICEPGRDLWSQSLRSAGTVLRLRAVVPHRVYLLHRTSLCRTISPRDAVRQPSAAPGLPTPIPTTAGSLSVLNSDLPQLSDIAASPNGSADGSRVSVIVVATERLFRHGLAGLLSRDDRLDVIGVSDDEADLLALCKSRAVDVVLMDIQLSRSNAIDLVRSIASECPHTKTLVLTSSADWRVRPTMIAGAGGVLLKDTSPEAIMAAVVSIHLGDRVLCNETARWVLGEEPSTHLTQREWEVFRMISEGANNSEIAEQLQLGQKTVRNYVSRLYRKLDLTNRAQIATYLAQSDIPGSASWSDLAPAEDETSVDVQ